MQLKQQGAEFQKETSRLLLTWISWRPTLETSFDVGRCCFQREACIRLLMAFIYALLLIEFRFLCFLLLLFCRFLTACFSVKLMNISVESFSWLFDGNCCGRCSLPGSARLLLSGSKERLVLEAAGPGATGALWDPGRERGNRRSLGPSDTTRVLTFLHTLD